MKLTITDPQERHRCFLEIRGSWRNENASEKTGARAISGFIALITLQSPRSKMEWSISQTRFHGSCTLYQMLLHFTSPQPYEIASSHLTHLADEDTELKGLFSCPLGW